MVKNKNMVERCTRVLFSGYISSGQDVNEIMESLWSSLAFQAVSFMVLCKGKSPDFYYGMAVMSSQTTLSRIKKRVSVFDFRGVVNVPSYMLLGPFKKNIVWVRGVPPYRPYRRNLCSVEELKRSNVNCISHMHVVPSVGLTRSRSYHVVYGDINDPQPCELCQNDADIAKASFGYPQSFLCWVQRNTPYHEVPQ